MGSESTQEKKFDVAELRMLRWMSRTTKLDRIRNEEGQRRWEKYQRKCRKVGLSGIETRIITCAKE